MSSFSNPVSRPQPQLYRRLRMMIAAVVLPMLLLTVAVVIGVSRNTQERTAEGILQTARGVMASADAELKGYTGALRFLADSPALRAGDLAAFQPEAARFVVTFPGERANVVLADADGNIRFSALPLPRPLKRGSMAGVREVFAKKAPYVSDMYMGAVTRVPVFAVEVPVMKDGEVVLNLSFNPPREAFYSIVESLDLPPGWVISIFDRNYRHVARYPSLRQDILTSAAESLQAELSKSREGTASTISLEGVELLTAYTTSADSGWIVAIGLPAEDLTASVNQALVLTVAFSGLFYLVAAAFAYRLARGVTRAETERKLLINELNHRVKNTLAAVQAIVSQTLRRSTDLAQVRGAIQNRLMAMSRAHTILSDRNWADVDLAALVNVILLAYEDAALSRVRIAGPPLTLAARQAVPLAMVINELATNAMKHGALSGVGGALAITWRKVGANALLFLWEESGVAALPPAATGFGTFFTERAVIHELGGEIARDYAADGLKVRIQFTLEAPPLP